MLFFTEKLLWTEDASVAVFSYTSSAAYFLPLLGGYVADVYWGKYATILRFSCLYAAGTLLLALSAVDKILSAGLACFGLALISAGTGGIKPNVSSFGADQFEQGDERSVSRYFHIFYMSINVGSVASFFYSPQFSGRALDTHLPFLYQRYFWGHRLSYFGLPESDTSGARASMVAI